MDPIIWIQILDEAACVSLHANAFGKIMNPSLPSHLSYGLIVWLIGFFSLGKATSLEGKLWIQTKLTLCHILSIAELLGKYILVEMLW